ncbi:MAG TPA: deoxyribonuclease IV [Candidatus Dormibacteraeota bacterium]|nr:deoxyribonuclease IV [Candidatus Dormibacteraeota bacterium]
MRFGLHMRLGDGYEAAVDRAHKLGCTTMQVFTSNPRAYRQATPKVEALAAFAAERARFDLDPAVTHTPYLINLASEDPKIFGGSVNLLKHDLHVAALAGIALVNTHLGSYGKRDRAEGFAAIVGALEEVLAGIPPAVTLVMENSAGAGALAGGTLEELGALLRAVGHRQFGVCIDTAHAWAAGYKIDTPDDVDRFVAKLEALVGIENVRMFHFNDTEIALGGNRDRHWHIGQGLIGEGGFRALLSHREFHQKLAILETPGDDADDERNMATIRRLYAEVA